MEHPGREERELTVALVAGLPESADPALRFGAADLRRAAEHLLYTALVAPAPVGGSPARTLARLARAALGGGPMPPAGAPVVALVTQPVHAKLFAPVAASLADGGLSSVVLDAETRRGLSVDGPGIDGRLTGFLRRADLPALAAHAVASEARLRRLPAAWREVVDAARGAQLLAVLRRGLPLVALDVARTGAMVERLEPCVIACFSESGLLGRVAPAAAHPHGIRVVDLPHAEAADPWGSAGLDYDGVAVYGPRAASVMRLAGVDAERIAEIGPLSYDRLLAAPATPPATDPRRVLLASQPTDPARPHLRPEVKARVLEAAIAAAGALEPAELIVVPHPTERELDIPARIAARVERAAGLHDLLPGAWLLVTGSSQSVFDAVVAGVPALTVNPTELPDPVTFAAEGIAMGAGSVEEAAAAANGVRDPAARSEVASRQRAALGARIGPLDGRAAERAAAFIGAFADAPLESSPHEHP